MIYTSMPQAIDSVFEYEHFYNLNTVSVKGSIYPWYYLDDIRRAIGYKGDLISMIKNMDKPLDGQSEYIKIIETRQNCIDNSDKYKYQEDINTKKTAIISLPGIFELLRHIKLTNMDNVTEFWSWICNSILPQLFYNPKLGNELNKSIKEYAELTDIYNSSKSEETKSDLPEEMIKVSENIISIIRLSELLNNRGYNNKVHELYDEMRDDGFLCKDTISYNLPTNNMILEGYMCIVYHDGKAYTYVTPKGQEFLIKYYMNKLIIRKSYGRIL